MPPKLRGPLPRRLSRLTETGGGAGGGLFYCPSCARWRRTLSTATTGRSTSRREHPSDSHHRRPASSLATSSAINVSGTVPARFRELYEALDRVRETAAEQVSLSRLQLAQRGLESEEPVIRVAGRLTTPCFFICDLFLCFLHFTINGMSRVIDLCLGVL